jgi:hypothetical protein
VRHFASKGVIDDKLRDARRTRPRVGRKQRELPAGPVPGWQSRVGARKQQSEREWGSKVGGGRLWKIRTSCASWPTPELDAVSGGDRSNGNNSNNPPVTATNGPTGNVLNNNNNPPATV